MAQSKEEIIELIEAGLKQKIESATKYMQMPDEYEFRRAQIMAYEEILNMIKYI